METPSPLGAANGGEQSNQKPKSAAQYMLIGCIGFSMVSVAGFSVWAFGGYWLGSHIGESGLFAACAVVFLVSAGLLLFQLVDGPNRLWRFYKIFLPAFLIYAVAWSAAWFVLKFGLGEWLGSLLGSIAFTAVVAWGFGTHRSFAKTCVVLFVCHSAGYFLGAEFMRSIARAAKFMELSKSAFAHLGMLGWGAIYGAGFGAGIGYVFHAFQK